MEPKTTHWKGESSSRPPQVLQKTSFTNIKNHTKTLPDRKFHFVSRSHPISHCALPSGTLVKALWSWFGWQRGGRSFAGKPGREHGHIGLGAIVAILKAHGTHCATGAGFLGDRLERMWGIRKKKYGKKKVVCWDLVRLGGYTWNRQKFSTWGCPEIWVWHLKMTITVLE